MKKQGIVSAALLISAMLISGCTKWDKAEGPTDIRVKNLSAYVFNNVHVDTGHGENDYGTIGPGQSTEYKRFEKAYREALITLEIDGIPYTFTPVSYTYEVYLGRGKFTYEVWVEGEGENLSLDMEVNADAPLD